MIGQLIVTLALLCPIGRAQELSSDLWKLSKRAWDAAYAVYLPSDAVAYVGLENYFDDLYDDAALIDEDDDACVVAFRGSSLESIPIFIRDWLSNFNLGEMEVCSRENPEYCCMAHIGFTMSYMADYQDELESRIDACLQAGKELVFTGHSQGSGIAQIATLIYEAADPKLIAFASPPAFAGSCLADRITNDKIHIINSLAAHNQRMAYDPITVLYQAYGFPEGSSKSTPQINRTAHARSNHLPFDRFCVIYSALVATR